MEYRVGIDLGGTNVAVGVVNENKEIVARANVPTRPDRMLDDVIYDIACCVKEAVKKAGITLQECVLVGIGSPGYCRAADGMVVYAGNLGWKNVPICDELRLELGVSVRLSNDANCAALGEVVAGAAKGAKSAVLLTLGTGVGGGVMRDLFAGDRPYIFVKHVYACAALLGAIAFAALKPLVGLDGATVIGFALIVVIRFCSARFHWSLPKARL